jgi:hypothetical protein
MANEIDLSDFMIKRFYCIDLVLVELQRPQSTDLLSDSPYTLSMRDCQIMIRKA